MKDVARSIALLLLITAPRVDAQRATILPVDCRASVSTAIPPQLSWNGDRVQHATWDIALGARRIPVQVVLVQFDPRQVALSLELIRDENAIAPWTIDRAPNDALLALNAGQFTDAGPWGWVVHRGREWQAPGTGSLAGAFVVDSSGKADVVDVGGMRRLRANGGVVEAVQSYPLLLVQHGVVPPTLCTANDDINREHRDTRLAIGVRVDGSVVIAMTRYDGAGAVASRLPVGPTTPEMVEIMRRVGAVRAVMLDGGLSAQLMVRGTNGAMKQWPGLRAVPLALVGRAKT